jgi:hypothetical protein
MHQCRYKSVIDTIKGFGEQSWAEAIDKMASMADKVGHFQEAAKALPKVHVLCSTIR